MRRLNWVVVAAVAGVLVVVTRAPLVLDRLHAAAIPHRGDGTFFGSGPWSDPRALAVVFFTLAVFVWACITPGRYREILIGSGIASLGVLALLPVLWFAAIIGVSLACPFVWLLTRLTMGVQYYGPPRRPLGQSPPAYPETDPDMPSEPAEMRGEEQG